VTIRELEAENARLRREVNDLHKYKLWYQIGELRVRKAIRRRDEESSDVER
jgi:hypothetical protein